MNHAVLIVGYGFTQRKVEENDDWNCIYRDYTEYSWKCEKDEVCHNQDNFNID